MEGGGGGGGGGGEGESISGSGYLLPVYTHLQNLEKLPLVIGLDLNQELL